MPAATFPADQIGNIGARIGNLKVALKITPSGALPRLDDLAPFVLPNRRTRRYARTVKRHISRYLRKLL